MGNKKSTFCSANCFDSIVSRMFAGIENHEVAKQYSRFVVASRAYVGNENSIWYNIVTTIVVTSCACAGNEIICVPLENRGFILSRTAAGKRKGGDIYGFHRYAFAADVDAGNHVPCHIRGDKDGRHGIANGCSKSRSFFAYIEKNKNAICK